MFSDSHGENRPDNLDARLRSAGRLMTYPPTPDLAAREQQRVQALAHGKQNGRERISGAPGVDRRSATVTRRRWMGLGWALAVIVLLASLLLVSPVRARVVEWLRLGAVRLFLQPGAGLNENNGLETLADLAGETTLAEAAQQAPFPLMLPGYPPDLKEPQRVYVQKINGAVVVISVWLKLDSPEEVRLALYQIGDGDVFQKQLARNVQESYVNGLWALWVEGPYLLTTVGGQAEERRIVQGHTLIWSPGVQTYRLETDLPLEEARKIAESLKEWKGK